MDSLKKVSVIIPTYNGGKFLSSTLEMVFRQRLSSPPEVVCVDSGSRDDTLKILGSFPVRIVKIPREEFNHGQTRNLGARESTGDALCFLVQDALARDKEWLPALLRALEREPRIAGAFSRQIPRPDCNPFIRERLVHGSASGEHSKTFQIGCPEEYRRLPPAEKRAAVAFDNVSSIIRRSVWESFPFPSLPFGEDLSWAKRVMEEGYLVLYEPSSQVIHSHNRSLWKEFKRIYADCRNQKALFGLDHVPGLRMLLFCTWKDFRRYCRAVRRELKLGPRRFFYSLYALPFSAVENTAKFLGGKGGEWAGRKSWYRILDRVFTRGL